ncbi:hypothetical protein PROFUN_13573 [Planoprotostelium fungivorum]|uniref:Uncharacterized protein n=1 Tax=Planoprotostelium fungivorum TaxID=1890364 RepID=A0A2P6N3G4_9EUKA|nr:hypothetical protein PROFUN_13573 [Planoprotostelium fungivorum]
MNQPEDRETKCSVQAYDFSFETVRSGAVDNTDPRTRMGSEMFHNKHGPALPKSGDDLVERLPVRDQGLWKLKLTRSDDTLAENDLDLELSDKSDLRVACILTDSPTTYSRRAAIKDIQFKLLTAKLFHSTVNVHLS